MKSSGIWSLTRRDESLRGRRPHHCHLRQLMKLIRITSGI